MATLTSRQATTPALIESINPATGALLRAYAPMSSGQIDDVIATAQTAQHAWADHDVEERAMAMRRLATHLREHRQQYGSLITQEMGKPITEAIAEVEKCAWACEFYAQNGPELLRDEAVVSSASKSLVTYEPLGVILGIMPWNFPFWQVFRFATGALMAGNGAVVKHASNVPQCALAIESAFREAGFPPGLLSVAMVTGADVAPLISDERIAAVTLTGSSETGARVASLAGQSLKKIVLELGGIDPFIVLADADLEQAVATGVKAGYLNAGQSCIAAKRFLVDDAVADDFEERLTAAAQALVVGDPSEPGTQIGPLARRDLVDALERQVDASVRQGARVLTGGKRRAGPGFFFEPTVISDVTEAMPVVSQEAFGPVAAILRVRGVEEAITVANGSEYGLGSSVWTRDPVVGEQVARRLQAGAAFVNGMTASDPRLPFGGVKHSGYGRELGALGIREFTNVKTIWIGPAVRP